MKTLAKSAVTAVALSVITTAALATELKFANYMPASNPYVAGAFEPLATKLSEATNGEVTVKIYSGGELGAGPVEQFMRAVDGVADLVVSLPGYTASQFPLTLMSELPGVMTEETGTQKLLDNRDLFQSEFRRVHLVSLWSNAENVLYTRDKPVHTSDDVKGMKIRVPSRNTGLVVESWGATPVSMPVSDIYNALQTGVIDGALIDGTGTRAFKLGEVAQYLTVGMDTTLSPFYIVMNRDSFEGLSEEQQQAVDEIGKDVSVLANQTQLDAAHKGIEAFGEMDGKTVIQLSEEEAKAFNDLAHQVTEQVVAEGKEQGLPAQEIVDALSSE
ncbi:TRAP transporter substrate-binding protein [Consotaella aegiceratis]|uniref:TRAP transporter substrate-binding protein n=1 Tax=Consotaella aegiceratis TaxID=3097961 RepID=UPI002F41D8D4